MRAKLKAIAAMFLLAVIAPPAQATFHLMKVVEVFPGTAAAPDAQYVVIQMYAAGQNLVDGHPLTVYNAAGTLVATFTFAGDVSNGASQSKILIATSQAQTFFGVTANLTMSPSLLSAGGKVCFDTIDCVAWGAYTGSAAGVGTPFNAAGGLQSGRAAIRRLDIAGSANSLDAGDDTNNCATDFIFGLPAPRNNAGMIGAIPGATCGNGALEGLEQCDDHNLVNGDGCSSTCAIDQVISRRSGDYDGDGKSDVLWRNTSTGANMIWKSANVATPQATTTVTDQNWKIVGKGDFDDDGKSDVFWRNTSTGANTIWRSGNSATPQTVSAIADPGWKVGGVGDFDGDGKSDVFWRNTNTGNNTIWKSGNSATPQTVSAIVDQDWKVVGVGDFDGDGKSDVFWRDTDAGANVIWKSGNSATPQTVSGVADLSWKVVGVGDLDGDGKSDVLWRNTSTGANAIWKSGNSATPQTVSALVDLDWKVAGMGDFDGDGKSDVFWRNTSTGANTIWRSGSSATTLAAAAVTDQTWTIVPYEWQPQIRLRARGQMPRVHASSQVLRPGAKKG